MDIILILLNLLTLIAVLIFGYFRSYSAEKGKNLATKEDVSAITHKIESIKNQIHFTTQNKLTLKSAERDVLIDLFEKYHLWLSSMMDITLFMDDDDLVFKKLLAHVDTSRANCELANFKTKLFIENEDLENIFRQLYGATLELQGKLGCLPNALGELKAQEGLDLLKNSNDSEVCHKLKMDYMKKSKDIFINFIESRTDSYKEIIVLENGFRQILNNLIMETLENESD